MEISEMCPFGKKCEEQGTGKFKGKLLRCAWFTHLVGKNPQSEEHIDEWKCALAWLPLLTVEVSQSNRGAKQALRETLDLVQGIMQAAHAAAADHPSLPRTLGNLRRN
jgi:hypothetical protein